MKLSPRLQLVAAMVPPGVAVADVGSGHGAIAAALAERGQRVVATEVRASTLAALRADLDRAGAEVETRQGSGFAPLQPGEVGVAVVAGMGGRTIVRILEESAWFPQRLVLQPMQDTDAVRAWLDGRSWAFREATARQRGRVYSAFAVEPTSA